MTIIYGIDTEKPIKPEDIRDAVVVCFVQAHKEVLSDIEEFSQGSTQEEIEELKRINVRQIIRKAFEDTGGDFEHPTKESIIECCSSLKNFATNFRNPELVQKHFNQIMELVNKL